MTFGKLYGVGAGPGAPDLLTLRAVRILESVPVLALPRGSDFGTSMAWKIVKPSIKVRPEQEKLVLTFPMSKDPDRIRPYFEIAFTEIGARLERGLDVAFVTEGDPSLFSTFIYVKREVMRRWPEVAIEIVPGITSVTAVPSVTGVPLADGQERIAILPATYGIDDLVDVLTKFDTVVLMKLGGEMPKVIAALEQTKLLERAVFVSKATMQEQRIERDLRQVGPERGDCFAMVIVSRQERNGALAGESPFTTVAALQLDALQATPIPESSHL